MISKWEYKFSLFSGIFFILIFILKELFLNININKVLIIMIYFVLILLNASMFLGYIKYSLLNNKKMLLYTTVSLISTNILMIILECFSNANIKEISSISIISGKILTCLVLFIWSLSLIIKGKIYGHSQFLLGVIGILLAATYIVPILNYLGLPFYLLFYMLVVIPFTKKKNKENGTRLLRR